MRRIGLYAVLLAAAATSGAAPVFAADTPFGEREYQTRCAMCHGVSGAGDGWLSGYLIGRIPTLTRLKKSNGGVFPSEKVKQVIDGRTPLKMHGPAEMPVWGQVYRDEQELANQARSGVAEADERLTRVKILALIDYLSRLQE